MSYRSLAAALANPIQLEVWSKDKYAKDKLIAVGELHLWLPFATLSTGDGEDAPPQRKWPTAQREWAGVCVSSLPPLSLSHSLPRSRSLALLLSRSLSLSLSLSPVRALSMYTHTHTRVYTPKHIHIHIYRRRHGLRSSRGHCAPGRESGRGQRGPSNDKAQTLLRQCAPHLR